MRIFFVFVSLALVHACFFHSKFPCVHESCKYCIVLNAICEMLTIKQGDAFDSKKNKQDKKGAEGTDE